MAGTIVLLAPSAGTLARILAGGAVAVLGLSYAGLILLPEAAIHPASGVEAFHAGLWRGIYSHKNMAGPLMASLVFVGIYLMRRGQHWLGAGIAVLALIFVWNTGSKTSAALAPAIVIMVLLPAMTGMRTLAAIAVLAAIISINALTIGSVFVPGFDAILRTFNETTTFTGRTEIWEFAGDFVLQRPWTGFGFDSFWGTGITADAEQPFDRAWDPRGIIHGHNGFLDIALFMGVPAMLLAVWLFVIAPVWQYIRTPSLLENALLADLCLMIVAFLVMNSALESYFFRRADPAWLTLVIALMGLRLCARQRIVDR
ncbi:O-antigen ligase family protein [Oricola sp.]|uniref:O-antigen ligase family protein n=1 Tax=Oricola sp. TaxID=1979950 RepID=UPI003BA95EA8